MHSKLREAASINLREPCCAFGKSKAAPPVLARHTNVSQNHAFAAQTLNLPCPVTSRISPRS
jgi:hypothetical protein